MVRDFRLEFEVTFNNNNNNNTICIAPIKSEDTEALDDDNDDDDLHLTVSLYLCLCSEVASLLVISVSFRPSTHSGCDQRLKKPLRVAVNPKIVTDITLCISSSCLTACNSDSSMKASSLL